jgi:hypothetical protein
VYKATGKRDPLLDAFKPDECEQALFTLWQDIRRACPVGMNGIMLTWGAIKEYQEVTGYELTAFEIDAVLIIENTVMEAANGNR